MQTGLEVKFHGEVMISAGSEDELCTGLGVATCKKIGDIAIDFTLGLDANFKYSRSSSTSNEVTLAFEYTYATSTSPFIPSKLGDMFLLPSLNIKFTKSALIAFDPATCAGNSTDVLTWSLDSPANVPVCNWFALPCFSRLRLDLVGIYLAKLR
jgi:hypothetical protein